MKRLLLNLYPRAWRERYGDELEALMADAPGGWGANFDLIRGAMTMRWKVLPAWKMVLGCLAAGAVAGWAVSYLMPEMWEAKAVLQITPSRVRSGEDLPPQTNELLLQMFYKLTSRASLTELVADPRLNLHSDPDHMRAAIRVVVMAEGQTPRRGTRVFSISYTSTDPQKAVDITNALISKLVTITVNDFRTASPPERATFYIDTLDRPVLPKRPISPKRAAIAITGMGAGLIIALVALLFRRRTTRIGEGLQPA
jgi:uncharacterized protein involved in exopolysaccharide biosynthesis